MREGRQQLMLNEIAKLRDEVAWLQRLLETSVELTQSGRRVVHMHHAGCGLEKDMDAFLRSPELLAALARWEKPGESDEP